VQHRGDGKSALKKSHSEQGHRCHEAAGAEAIEAAPPSLSVAVVP
jgi:hypothetical protein